MEEPEKACHKQDKQKKMVIRIGKGGGGGGLGGLILLAGVLATAAVASTALTLKRRHQKSCSNKNNNQQSPLKESNETLDDSNNDEATKGLQMIVSDFSSEGNHQLSNGKTRKAVSRSDLTCLITAESLILNDEKMTSGIDGGNEGPISMDDSMIKMEEFSSPRIDKLLHFEPYSMEKHVPDIEIQVIKQHDAAEATLVDRVVKEGNHDMGGRFEENHDMEACSERKQVEEDQNYDGEINDEIAKGDCIVQKIQMDEQQETPDSVAQEIITIDCSIQECSEVDGKELLLSSCDNLSFNKDAKLNNSCEEGAPQIGSDEAIKTEEAIEVAEGDQIEDIANLSLNGKEVENCDRLDDEILTEKFDEAGEVKQDNADIALNEQKVENCDHLDEEILANECDEAGETKQDNADSALDEQKVESCDQHDEEIITEKCDETGETKKDDANAAINEQKVENRDQHDEEILTEKCDETGETKQDDADAALNEQKVENCYQLDEEIVAEKCDKEGEIKQADEIVLVSKEAENSLFDQPLPESILDEDSGTEETNSGEVHLEPASLIYISSEVNQQPTDHIEAIEEDVSNKSFCREGMVEDEGNPTIQLIKKQQCDDDGEGDIDGEIPEIISADIVRAEDNPIARISDEAEDAKDNEIDDDDYDDIVTAEDDPIVQTSDEEENAEDNEIDDNDNDDDDIFTAEDDPVARMTDEEESAIDSETDDYNDDEDKEEEDHEVNCAEIVEASSEGTGDSSLESSAEAIWPTETIQELSMVLEAVKLHEQKEGSNSEEEEAAEADDNANGKQENDRNGKPKLISVEKCMEEFVTQHDQILKSTKWRILIGTGLALLWLLCFRYFLAYPS